MICCKIIANFSSKEGQFSVLLNKLGSLGDVLWDNNSLFFADVENDISEKKILSIIKKSGYGKGYIDIYTKENSPHENDYINGWINDKLIKICYNKCEQESQKIFKDISVGLDILNEEIDAIAKNKK